MNIAFSRFSRYFGSSEFTYNLISNRSGKNFLLKKLKNIDFIFQVHLMVRNATVRKITATLEEDTGMHYSSIQD